MQNGSHCQIAPRRTEVPETHIPVVTQSRVLPRTASIPIDVRKESRTVYVVDYDVTHRDAVRAALEQDGYRVKVFSDCETFLGSYRHSVRSCLVIDALLLGVHGLDLIAHLNERCASFKCIVTAMNATLSVVVQAIKAGAADFVAKSLNCAALLASVSRAFEETDVRSGIGAELSGIVRRISTLTPRQHQVLERVLAGHPSKNIAADLGISQRTVENHRAEIGRKAGSRSLAGLVHAGVCSNCSLNHALHAT